MDNHMTIVELPVGNLNSNSLYPVYIQYRQDMKAQISMGNLIGAFSRILNLAVSRQKSTYFVSSIQICFQPDSFLVYLANNFFVTANTEISDSI